MDLNNIANAFYQYQLQRYNNGMINIQSLRDAAVMMKRRNRPPINDYKMFMLQNGLLNNRRNSSINIKGFSTTAGARGITDSMGVVSDNMRLRDLKYN